MYNTRALTKVERRNRISICHIEVHILQPHLHLLKCTATNSLGPTKMGPRRQHRTSPKQPSEGTEFNRTRFLPVCVLRHESLDLGRTWIAQNGLEVGRQGRADGGQQPAASNGRQAATNKRDRRAVGGTEWPTKTEPRPSAQLILVNTWVDAKMGRGPWPGVSTSTSTADIPT